MRRLRRQFDRGGFGFKAKLLGPDLIGRLVPMPLSQPGRIVESGELGQRETKLIDRGEVPDPEELLLQRQPVALAIQGQDMNVVGSLCGSCLERGGNWWAA